MPTQAPTHPHLLDHCGPQNKVGGGYRLLSNTQVTMAYQVKALFRVGGQEREM